MKFNLTSNLTCNIYTKRGSNDVIKYSDYYSRESTILGRLVLHVVLLLDMLWFKFFLGLNFFKPI